MRGLASSTSPSAGTSRAAAPRLSRVRRVMATLPTLAFHTMYRRFVALGDSTTEGLMDLNPDGTYRGWADRLAERLAQDEPDLLYANLAVRGKLARQVREE